MAPRTLNNNAKPSRLHAPESKLVKNAANPVEVHADYGVWDTVLNKFLQEGKDFDGRDLFRK